MLEVGKEYFVLEISDYGDICSSLLHANNVHKPRLVKCELQAVEGDKTIHPIQFIVRGITADSYVTFHDIRGLEYTKGVPNHRLKMLINFSEKKPTGKAKVLNSK